ncbi:hypothetical protein [Halomarina ordinaria]|uniref:hypothetical protein n=1 Tax=Halomarina ordinaria TaxID=3033939 RepID=UPI0026F43FF8|nr:hypothetical protein [Halomarina sp. PSRA2]
MKRPSLKRRDVIKATGAVALGGFTLATPAAAQENVEVRTRSFDCEAASRTIIVSSIPGTSADVRVSGPGTISPLFFTVKESQTIVNITNITYSSDGTAIFRITAKSLQTGAIGVIEIRHHEDCPVPAPQTRADCLNGGWEMRGFRNQGQCMQCVESGKGCSD